MAAETKLDMFSVARQAWFSLAFWLSFGLLIEGLIGFRSPVYLQDPIRRELFRLAHAHGALLSIVMLAAVLYIRAYLAAPPAIGLFAMRIGVVLMPAGFLLGGIWHYESDPGIGVFLAPIGGILIIFGVVTIALSRRDST